MTSTAPGAHPPSEEVDALLDPSGGDARVSAHVDACERCRQVRDDLREVRAVLGAQARTLPPEPADLGARIAAALAAEPPLRPAGRADVAAPLTAVPAPSAPDTAADPGRDRSGGGQVLALPTRRRWPAYLAVAASVAVVGLGGTFLAGTLGGGGGSDAGTAAEVSSAEDSAGGGAAAPGVSVPPGSIPDQGVQARDGQVRASGTEYTRADLAAQAAALLVAGDVGTDQLEPQALEFAGGGREDCLTAVGRAGVEPAAVDVATYEGQDAVVLVLPSGRGFDVLVVPVGCGSGDDRVLAETRLR